MQLWAPIKPKYAYTESKCTRRIRNVYHPRYLRVVWTGILPAMDWISWPRYLRVEAHAGCDWNWRQPEEVVEWWELQDPWFVWQVLLVTSCHYTSGSVNGQMSVEFCVWRAVLWLNFGNVGSAAIWQKCVKCICASHKSNLSSVPQDYVDTSSTLPWVKWEAVTSVEGIPLWGWLWHMLANGALVYPRQGGRYRAEGCMALRCDSSVVNDSLGEPCRTPLHIELPSAWGSVEGDCVFSPNYVGGLRFGDSDRYKRMNKSLALETEHLSPWGPCWGNMEGGSLTG
jgi:hypothetical protein